MNALDRLRQLVDAGYEVTFEKIQADYIMHVWNPAEALDTIIADTLEEAITIAKVPGDDDRPAPAENGRDAK